MSPVQPSLFSSKHNHSVSINENYYDKKVGATQTDPDLALRHMARNILPPLLLTHYKGKGDSVSGKEEEILIFGNLLCV